MKRFLWAKSAEGLKKAAQKFYTADQNGRPWVELWKPVFCLWLRSITALWNVYQAAGATPDSGALAALSFSDESACYGFKAQMWMLLRF